jgi:hypothetical protein
MIEWVIITILVIITLIVFLMKPPPKYKDMPGD